MDRLKQLENHCLGIAESEMDFLVNAFVVGDAYREILSGPPNSPIILLGKKGTGKTALLKYLSECCHSSSLDSLYLKPDDLVYLDDICNADGMSAMKRKAHQSLVHAISLKLGSEFRGILGRKDKKIFDKAVREGARDPDTIQVCLKGLATLGSIATKIDFEKLVPSTSDPSYTALRRSLKSNFEKSDRTFFLLLDDVDQIASMVQSHQINRIWGFILAAKKLSEELANFRTVVSLRTEIWYWLLNDRYGQRDQVDHIRGLLRRLDPKETEIKKILRRRLEVVCDIVVGVKSCGYEKEFFEEKTMTLPNTDGAQREWIDFIAKNSRQRPRDALQLLHELSAESRKIGATKISNGAVEKADSQYSHERVDDLSREYAQECNVLREIIGTFSELSFIVDTESLKKHLERLPSKFRIEIHGKALNDIDGESVFIVWNFLHKTGFINARIPDNTAPRKFRHIMHDEEATFVSRANWQEMQKVAWEVHPAYSSHLLSLSDRDRRRKGISLRDFFGGKKKKR